MSDKANLVFPENPTNWKELIALATPQDAANIPGQIMTDVDQGWGHYERATYRFFESGIYTNHFKYDLSGDYCGEKRGLGVWRRAPDGALWAISAEIGDQHAFTKAYKEDISAMIATEMANNGDKVTKTVAPTEAGTDIAIGLKSVAFPIALVK